MREARALVFPSVWYEGQPLTVYEALALGTPVIVSDACAGREAVSGGETGFWFRSGDARALAARLTQLSDDALAGRMSTTAYTAYWAAPLTIKRHLATLLSVYEIARREVATANLAPAKRDHVEALPATQNRARTPALRRKFPSSPQLARSDHG
jgi:glycosyltransferase involved in cell wall biosynthesis